MRSTLLLPAMVVVALLVAACGAEPTPSTFESPVEIANPASQHCVEQGYELEMRLLPGRVPAGYTQALGDPP